MKKTISGVRARSSTVTYEKGRVTVPCSSSYRFSVCACDPPCGNITVVLEDDNGKPFAVSQFSYGQILGDLTECALEAKALVGEKTN